MGPILSNKKKFQCIGDAESHDQTLLEEKALQAFLLNANKGTICQKRSTMRSDL